MDSPDVWDELLVVIEAEERAAHTSLDNSLDVGRVRERLKQRSEEHGGSPLSP
jgi:hypothetical protein